MYLERAETFTNTHTCLYRSIRPRHGRCRPVHRAFLNVLKKKKLKVSLSNFNLDILWWQNIMVTIFPFFLSWTKPLIILDFGQNISIITKGFLLRLFHFSGVFRLVDPSPLSSAPVWGQDGPAATLCWMSCWIWLSVKEWWTSTTVSRPSAPDASTWSRLKWVGGQQCG